MIKNKCEVCYSNQYKTIDIREMMFGTKHVFQYLVCDTCNSLSLEKIPENLDFYYPEDYYSFTNVKGSKIKEWVKYTIELHSLGSRNFFGFLFSGIFGIEPNLKAIKSCNPNKDSSQILDIGSGGGILLKKLSKHGFHKLHGIDPYLVDNINENGVKIEKATVADLLLRAEKYDIIMMSHVLEHFDKPNESLKDIVKLLKDNGRLIIRVPIASYAFNRFKENWYQIDAPRHIFVPSLDGMLILGKNMNLVLNNYFFDSSSAQFIASKNYAKGIPLKDMAYPSIFKRLAPQKIYYSMVSRVLNRKDKGDQATFIFSKN